MEKTSLLDGTAILRFAHAFESGGGTERYLDDLDRALLTRNSATILRLHLTRNPSPDDPTEEPVGKGTLVHVPLPVLPMNDSAAIADEHSLRFRFKQKARNWVLYNSLVWKMVGAHWVSGHRLTPQPGQAIGAGAAAAAVFRTRRIDLVILHFFGGADAESVIVEAQKADVPVALLNHYSNDRFSHLAIRKHAMLADGVAGVNSLDVPLYLRDLFTNLADGIDTEFFRRAHARPLPNAPAYPIILLPARVIREKGQMDLVHAATTLRQIGLACCIVFAGRFDSSGFVDDLRQKITRVGLTDSVRFLGALSVEELRDWYAASTVVVLPTYHHEGLPRVILEAQAMETPVIAYSTGGVADGIVSGTTGFLLPTGDIAGLTSRLRELLSSPSLRASMGTCGREAAETRFSLFALADRHERFYAQVIADFKAGRTKSCTS
jgi:glycosyltransferase involved in cell wall biosynthesis